MKTRAGVLLLAVCLASVALGGCGGSSRPVGGHTYILTPTDPIASGLYITIISPVRFPQSILAEATLNARFVKHTSGSQFCSETKQIQGVTGKYADLNGKTVTVEISGTNAFGSQACSILKRAKFNPNKIVGSS